MPPLSSDLKKAILAMPTTDKDKLLLRLVAKDQVLCEQLAFTLVDEETTLEERRNEIRKVIREVLSSWHYSPGEFMMALRFVNARIAYHIKITKDKYGEVQLPLEMLNGAFDEQFGFLETYTGRSDTLASYVAKRTQTLVQKLEKLHPDFHVEFEEDLNKLLERIHAFAPAVYARDLRLPKKWSGS